MRAALVTEYRKLTTTRLWWVLLLSMAAYMVFLGAVLGFSLTVDGGAGMTAPGVDAPEVPPLERALSIYALAPALGYVFPVVVGALAVTGEFRHATATPTFLAEPRRGVVLAAKLLSAVPVGLLFGVVGTVAAVAGGASVLAATGEDALLTHPEVLRAAGLSVLALTVWTMVGVGFGTVLTHQVAAVVTLLAFTQFVEPVLRLVLGAVDALSGLARYLPGAAGEAVTGASFYTAIGVGDLLPWWQGLLVLAGYGLLLALVGRFTTLRRDIT